MISIGDATYRWMFISVFIFLILSACSSGDGDYDDLSSEKYFEKKESEIALIYLGSSLCSFSNNKEFHVYFEKLSNEIRSIAKLNNYGFTSIGISIEANINNGWNHLNSIYHFDEVAVGNFDMNLTIQRYVWENYDGFKSGATPQVIISKRNFEVVENDNNIFIKSNIISEEILSRNVGVGGIKQLFIDGHLNAILQSE